LASSTVARNWLDTDVKSTYLTFVPQETTASSLSQTLHVALRCFHGRSQDGAREERFRRRLHLPHVPPTHAQDHHPYLDPYVEPILVQSERVLED
jgi:hypothetical protein